VKFLQFDPSVGSPSSILRFRVEAYRVQTQGYLCRLTLDVVVCPNAKPGNFGVVIVCSSIQLYSCSDSAPILSQGLAFQSQPFGQRGVVLGRKGGWLRSPLLPAYRILLIYVSHLKVGDEISKLLFIEGIHSPHLGGSQL
jgi:hypothetical protein